MPKRSARAKKKQLSPSLNAWMPRYDQTVEWTEQAWRKGNGERWYRLIVASDGQKFRLYILRNTPSEHLGIPTVASWSLRHEDGTPAGYGDLNFVPSTGRFGVTYARIRESYQRLGLYQRVLRALRKVLGPIQSDWSLTKSAAHAWEKLGAEYVRKRGGKSDYYKLNPRRNGAQDIPWTTWAAVGAGAVVAALLIREFVQKPIDSKLGQRTP
jgi:hypothetical protein